jgi:hypothetical protein
MSKHDEDSIEKRLTTKLGREWCDAVVVLLAVPPMWPNGSNPVHLCVRGARKGSVSLPTELRGPEFQGSNSGLPVLGMFDFHNKNSSESLMGDVDSFTTSMTLWGSSGRQRCGVTM